MRTPTRTLVVVAAVMFAATQNAGAQVTTDVPGVRPAAIIDLATREGVNLVHGMWRYHDAKIIEVDHRAPGPDLRPSGAPNRTYDITPHAGEADFDDSTWEVIEPTTLDARRANGKVSFNWYRIGITIPDRIGDFDPTGSTAVFEVVVDDYAEIWVNGELPLVLGQTGGSVAKGFNAPNRVIVARNVRPGEHIQLAVFGINGPISVSPGNFIWIRSATLDFYAADEIPATAATSAQVLRQHSSLDAIVPNGATIEKLASGFLFTEGPVWVQDGGYLLFSDPNANAIYRWTPDGSVSVFRTKSGYSGFDVRSYGQPGSNGLALDRERRLTIAEHGRRRIVRLERNGVITVLADRYEGKRLNSPNDLVYRSDGTLYFTDPPFGLPEFEDDPRKELPFSGVFMLRDGALRLLTTELKGPNGLAFSPDERYLYVGNWDPERKIVMRYEVTSDGGLAGGRVFFDMTSAPGEDAIDGVKVDTQGNVYVSGPGGVWILSAGGDHLGTISGPEHPHNMAWGDDDNRTLYLTAQTGVYRLRLKIPGAGAFLGPRTAGAGQ